MKDTMSHLRLALGKKKRKQAGPSLPKSSITNVSGHLSKYSALAKKKRGY